MAFWAIHLLLFAMSLSSLIIALVIAIGICVAPLAMLVSTVHGRRRQQEGNAVGKPKDLIDFAALEELVRQTELRLSQADSSPR